MLNTAEHSPELAFAYHSHLISRGFSSPLDMAGDEAERLLELAPHLETQLQPSTASLAQAWAEIKKDEEALGLAYAALFVGPFEILASPYASFYLEPEQRIMGPVSQQVAEAYAEAGLEPGSGPREVPDHIALEWEFIHYLTSQFLATGDPVWQEKRNRFYREHMQLWMPRFAVAVTQADKHPFYNALAEWLRHSLRAFPQG